MIISVSKASYFGEFLAGTRYLCEFCRMLCFYIREKFNVYFDKSGFTENLHKQSSVFLKLWRRHKSMNRWSEVRRQCFEPTTILRLLDVSKL